MIELTLTLSDDDLVIMSNQMAADIQTARKTAPVGSIVHPKSYADQIDAEILARLGARPC